MQTRSKTATGRRGSNSGVKETNAVPTYVRTFFSLSHNIYVGMRMATSPPASMPCASAARRPPAVHPSATRTDPLHHALRTGVISKLGTPTYVTGVRRARGRGFRWQCDCRERCRDSLPFALISFVPAIDRSEPHVLFRTLVCRRLERWVHIKRAPSLVSE